PARQDRELRRGPPQGLRESAQRLRRPMDLCPGHPSSLRESFRNTCCGNEYSGTFSAMAFGDVDVTPAAGGRWLATCDCGAFELGDTAEAGWQWVLAHPCEVVDVPHQAGPADDRVPRH